MAGRFRGTQLDRRDTKNFSSGAFNGDFASLFTPGTVLQSVQSDRGITYGGTMLATAGNTSTTTVTITGTLTSTPVPILVKAQSTSPVGPPTQFDVYYDGGSFPAMSGIIPSVGVAYPLTGAGAGLSLTFSAGSAVFADSWKATCAGWADQSGAALHYAQATPTAQPLLSVGLNGSPGILFDGVNDVLAALGFDLPPPGTTPLFMWSVYRVISTPGANAVIVTGVSGIDAILFLLAGSNTVNQYNAFTVNSIVSANGVWNRDEVYFSNSTNDYHRVGATTASGVNAGNNDPAATGRFLGAQPGPGAPCNVEMLAVIHANALPSVAQRAALSAAAITKYGVSVNV